MHAMSCMYGMYGRVCVYGVSHPAVLHVNVYGDVYVYMYICIICACMLYYLQCICLTGVGKCVSIAILEVQRLYFP